MVDGSAKVAVWRAEAAVERAEAAVERAEAEVRDAKQAAMEDKSFLPMYVSAQATLQASIKRLNDLEASSSAVPVVTAASQLVPFSDVTWDSTLPFKGRDEIVREVLNSVQHNVTAYMSRGGISRQEVLFTAIEGLAGVGKTRFLFEVKGEFGRLLKDAQTALAELHRMRSTAAVYLTFNGSAVGHSSPHVLHPSFVQLARDTGTYSAGQAFMRASLASQILYAKPWADLPSNLRDEILAEDDLTLLQKLSAHVAQGLGLVQPGQMVALYLLVDESQILSRQAYDAGIDGHDFLRGMFSWIAKVVANTGGSGCLAKGANLVIITLLAGTVLPVGGRYGISDWLQTCKTLPLLDVSSAVDALRQAVVDGRFETLRGPLEMLLEDCSCLPRLIKRIHTAWLTGKDMPPRDLVPYLRSSVFAFLQPWVDKLSKGSTYSIVKRMILLCITGAPVVAKELELEQCFNGYVYGEDVTGGLTKYRSSMILIHALGSRLGIDQRIIELRPQVAKADVLEDRFLGMVYARLCVYNGGTMCLGEILPGALGPASAHKMQITAAGTGVVQEVKQLCNPQHDQWFCYESDSYMMGTDGRQYIHGEDAGTVFKCKTNTVDGRVFLYNDQRELYEIWFQLKGQAAPVSKDQAQQWSEKALSSRLAVSGRKKVYVLCSRQGFSFSVADFEMGDVLLLNLQLFMPEFLRRCTSIQ